MGPMINKSDDNTVYTTAVYWVITTLTTVGYGDIKGYTPPEYFFQMVIEFLGIGVFSFLMNCISDLFTTDTTMQNIIDIRTEQIEEWLRKLEKSRNNKNFSKLLLDSVKEFTEKSY